MKSKENLLTGLSISIILLLCIGLGVSISKLNTPITTYTTPIPPYSKPPIISLPNKIQKAKVGDILIVKQVGDSIIIKFLYD